MCVTRIGYTLPKALDLFVKSLPRRHICKVQKLFACMDAITCRIFIFLYFYGAEHAKKSTLLFSSRIGTEVFRVLTVCILKTRRCVCVCASNRPAPARYTQVRLTRAFLLFISYNNKCPEASMLSLIHI